ncbi:MAG: Putative phage integrase [Leptospirillum sp. Group II 'C75']|jgi:integrase|nr:integrase arm-type DNA-binding domain-containing protein [Leptospirillum sp. Group II 'CF-1']AKS24228.1 integrase [Leptospirillum sp. Group II 'CF-1']EAY56570.1 MAG: putative phage integrase [Leptospirillum rubarum]EIJ77253.1 MAG: Putative phage integrase [Leptospirillum sp. Group II 'C75']
MALSDTQIKNAKPREKSYKLSDGGGLHVLVTPNGSKLWRLKYRIGGIEKLLSIGKYPLISLKEARDKAFEAKKGLSSGVDPSQAKKAQKASASGADSFETIAREWIEKFSPNWSETHKRNVIRRLELNLFPWIGKRPISEIKAPELLTVLRRIEGRGALETAHRASQNCGQVFRYAVATGRAERDPTGDLRGAIPTAREKHLAAITDPAEVGVLLRAIDGYSGGIVVKCALRLAPLVFVRPGELRHAEWSEINFDKHEWRIPAEKMKLRREHVVPLSRQAIEILNELHPLTGDEKYLFPSPRTSDRPMSENAVTAALRSLGYSGDQMTGHGFRSMASTLLNEQGWNRDAIERQLAHGDPDKIRSAYNRADHLPERRRMMQAWADYLDELKAGKEIIPFRKAE